MWPVVGDKQHAKVAFAIHNGSSHRIFVADISHMSNTDSHKQLSAGLHGVCSTLILDDADYLNAATCRSILVSTDQDCAVSTVGYYCQTRQAKTMKQ